MAQQKGIDRRNFLKNSAFGLAGVGAALAAGPAGPETAGGPSDTARIKSFRRLGRTGFRVSDIGIGTSQTFPAAVMGAALDAGVNYIDTGEGYGRGEAERSIAEAVKGRDRKSIFIATKFRLDGVTGGEQFARKVGETLDRLQTDYIDCLMLPGPQTAESVNNEIYHSGIEEMKKQGKVKFSGISSHGPRTPGQGEPMEKILLAAVEDGRFDVVLVVYNFVQKEAGEQVLEAASKRDVGVTIMKSNPLGRYFDMKDRIERLKKDGQTVDERMMQSMAQMEETMQKARTFLQRNGLKTPAEIKAAALKFVLGDPRVHTLNLAFNTFEDVQKAVALSGLKLSDKERGLLSSFEDDCGRLYCRHACGVCESSCPALVPVNTIMRYNHYFEAQGSEKFAMEKYAALEGPKVDACRNCPGWCEQACPYSVPVRVLLALARSQLTMA